MFCQTLYMRLSHQHQLGSLHLFFAMYEGISISGLLKRLKVTKQSLNRVLKDLVKLEIIIFKKDEIFYEGDQNTLYYKIYKRLGTYMMFL